MLKRWDIRNYDIELILAIFDFIDVNIESISIPKLRKYDIKTIIKALIIKEFEKLSLRSAEVRVKQIFGIRIDHTVFQEKKLASYMEEIVNAIMKDLHKLEYLKSFIDSTVFTNKKGENRDTRDNCTTFIL